MVDKRNFFDQLVTNYWRTSDNIWKFLVGQGDDYTTAYLLNFPYFEKYYKLIGIYSVKH